MNPWIIGIIIYLAIGLVVVRLIDKMGGKGFQLNKATFLYTIFWLPGLIFVLVVGKLMDTR